MATYIQVNIYNQTLDTLKLRGIDLATIMKTIGCGDTWISEVPIHPPARVVPEKEVSSPMTSSSASSTSSSTSSAPEATTTTTTTPPMKPFKTISAEICSIQPLELKEALKMSEPTTTTLHNLFDDWDPVTNLPTTSSSTSIELKTPKQEVVEEEEVEQEGEEEEEEEEDVDSMHVISGLLKPDVGVDPQQMLQKSRRKLLHDDPEIANTMYTIVCNYPGCTHQYNWRVKYGKLRLLDHALTHSNRRIPCKLCGFEAATVRRMRSHYGKHHPNERVQGYGMKALVNGGSDDGDETELGELWTLCYQPWIGLIGEASGMVDGDKLKRTPKKRKIDR